MLYFWATSPVLIRILKFFPSSSKVSEYKYPTSVRWKGKAVCAFLRVLLPINLPQTHQILWFLNKNKTLKKSVASSNNRANYKEEMKSIQNNSLVILWWRFLSTHFIHSFISSLITQQIIFECLYVTVYVLNTSLQV